jgi:arylsulfatase A-like enzyme
MRIVWIAVDTLRADKLGCYRPKSKKKSPTPHMDRIAARGVQFQHLIAENNVTQSAFTTMMTGKHPYQHGIVNMRPCRMPPSLIPLPLLLQKRGYKTAAIDCNHRITGVSNPWFKKGYDTYIDPSAARETHLNLPAREINRRAIPWLRQNKDVSDFFLFLHYWDPHYPYKPEESFFSVASAPPHKGGSPKLKEVLREPLWSFIHKWNKNVSNPAFIRSQYHATVTQVDHAIGELMDAMDQMGMLEDTLVLLVSDHGESLGEHKIYFDHHGLYDTTLHVPFLLMGPDLPTGRRIDTLCQHADILPTILDWAKIPVPRKMRPLDGRSLVPAIFGKKQKERPFVVSCEANWQLKRSIRTHHWKLIQSLQPDVYGNPRLELYHLKNDPKETVNLARRHAATTHLLRRKLEQWVGHTLRRYRRRDPLSRGIKVRLNRLTIAEEEKVKQRLSELGY